MRDVVCSDVMSGAGASGGWWDGGWYGEGCLPAATSGTRSAGYDKVQLKDGGGGPGELRRDS